VKSNSVTNQKDGVVRRVNINEQHAMWDYEEKQEGADWTGQQRVLALRHRLRSPLAKILCVFVEVAAEGILGPGKPRTQAPLFGIKSPTVGMTKDVSFCPSRTRLSVRLQAAMADDREVDLTTWDLPDETLEQAHACKVLRRFVAKWWAYNIERKARH
jgi:hypothetical protein